MRSLARKRATFCRIASALIVVTAMTGCTTMQQVPPPTSTVVTNEVEVGDTVEIIKINGDRVKFKVTQISQSGVKGKDEFVAYKDMRALFVRKVSTGDTLKLVGGIGGFIVVARAALKAFGKAMGALSATAR